MASSSPMASSPRVLDSHCIPVSLDCLHSVFVLISVMACTHVLVSGGPKSSNRRVYAVDLLGFGASDKPEDAHYSPEFWAALLCDFTKEFADDGAILIGNSIGSLTALTAAATGGADFFRGLVLLNCAGAMHRKGLMKENISIRLLSPIFILVEYLLQKPRIASFLFDSFRRKENIRKILEE